MRTYKTEAEVAEIIKARLSTGNSKARVSVNSDKQSENSVQRTVIFKATVALNDSEAIVNKMADIGADTDRAITYGGSQVEPTNEGEMRHLFFEAKINPYEEY
jgi:hypothetical protein